MSHCRLPGESIIVLDSPKAADAYLSTFPADSVTIHRQPFPNAEGLYARISYPGRIAQDKVYVNPPAP